MYLYTCTKPPKKSVSEKKLNEPLSFPPGSKLQCAALMLPWSPFLLRPASCTIFRVLLMMSSPLMVSALQQMDLAGSFHRGCDFWLSIIESLSILFISLCYHIWLYRIILLCVIWYFDYWAPLCFDLSLFSCNVGAFHSWLLHLKIFIMIFANWCSL